MNAAETSPIVPRWVTIATAICFFIPHIGGFVQLANSIAASPAATNLARLAVGSAIPLVLVLCIIRAKFLRGTATYLVLTIGFHVFLDLRLHRPLRSDFGYFFLLGLAFTGVFYLCRLQRACIT